MVTSWISSYARVADRKFNGVIHREHLVILQKWDFFSIPIASKKKFFWKRNVLMSFFFLHGSNIHQANFKVHRRTY